MKIAYFDPVGGVSGDMLVAALLDVGGDEERLLKDLARLPLDGWSWQRRQERRGGFGGVKIDFLTERNQNHQEERHLVDIEAIIAGVCFPENVKNTVLKTFSLLADAEAAAHGLPREQIHFHEVGAVDTILDICAVVLLLNQLDIEEIHCGPLPLGSGTVRCAHGDIPVPAPGLAFLLKDVPVYGNETKGETVTPTGIALLKAFNAKFGVFPPLTVRAAGVGLGSRDGDVPNLLRVFVGDDGEKLQRLYCLETTVDDMTGEELGFLWDKVYAAQANDMHYTPIYMKKGRPGVKITVLVLESHLEEVKTVLFRHTTTLGILIKPMERCFLRRHFEEIPTDYGKITMKCAEGYGVAKAKAEFEDLKAKADTAGKPLNVIRSAAEAAFLREHDKK